MRPVPTGQATDVASTTMEITIPEAALRANRTQDTIRCWIRSGRLRARRVGPRHMIHVGDLERMLGGAEAERWTRYLDLRDDNLADLSPASRARLGAIDLAAWLDEDRDTH